ncbi:hypothetical protein [Sphingobium bisphenolivorans]|uniref:hypothetical protein n=1 Tax=Sphingobium bisphenolivorans TaxID=1335760 RepID=UPI00039AFA1E
MKHALLLLALSAFPAQAAAPCKDAPPLAEPWTSWRQSGNSTAGRLPDAAPRLTLGKPVTVTLPPATQVQFPVPPAKNGSKSYAGLFTLALKSPARVGIALSKSGWVDAVSGKQALSPVNHGHGPQCSGIRKIVWFDMAAGLTTIQIADAASSTLRIMAADASANQPRPRIDKLP